MKTLFYGYGWRETKTWSCSDCKNFWACGMDLIVDEDMRRHQKECPARNWLKQILDEASARHELSQLKFQLTTAEVLIVIQYVKNVIASRPKSDSVPDATGHS